MANTLIRSRENFLRSHKEERVNVNGREWGVLHQPATSNITSPSLVLIPGTLGRGDIFWQQIAALEGRANILALTYPASGGIHDWANDILALMDRVTIESATILGSSLGGYLAQYFAAIYPKRVNNLIAANTLASTLGIDQIPPYRFDLINIPVDELRSGFLDGLKKTAQEQPELGELIELLQIEVGGRILEPELRARLQALKTGPEIPDLHLKRSNVFSVESDDDRLIPPPMRQAVRKQLQPIRSYIFESGSHFPYVARPKEYTSLLEEILGLEQSGEAWTEGSVTKR